MGLRLARMACGGIFVLAAGAVAPAQDGGSRSMRIEAGGLPLVRIVDDRFQSFQIGMSHLTGGETWRAYGAGPAGAANPGGVAADRSSLYESRIAADLESPRLRTLAAALGPFYLRYGGTTSNSVYFQDDDAPQAAKAPEGFTVVLTRAAWRRGLDFAKAVDAKILTGFAVSTGVRDGNGAWTPVTAAPWLAYTRSIGGEIYAAELFNEPNFPQVSHVPSGYGPAQFARDFAAFRAFANTAAPRLKLAGPGDAVIGVPLPSGAGNTASAERFLAAEPKPRFDILSYHFYGAVAERCAPKGSPMAIGADKALSEEWLARQDREFQEHKALRDRYAPGAPIWITETGAAACGGPQWQPTFLDTFRFLDTEARLAKQGLDAIFTHALISGSNGVIDEKTFLPRPDYWAAVLWRRLMGTGVLDTGAIRPGFHVYAHCLRGTAGGVAILAINLVDTPATLTVRGPADVYALTAERLQSDTAMLNGRPLTIEPGDRLPPLTPVRSRTGAITVAPTSISFVALPAAGNRRCALRG